MKKVFLILFIFMLTSSAFSQIKCTSCIPSDKVIELNLKDNKLNLDNVKSFKDLKIGDYYYVKIFGINQINYQVLISQKDTLVTDTLKLPSFSDFDIESISEALSTVDFGGIVPQIKKVKKSSLDNDLNYLANLIISARNKLVSLDSIISVTNDNIEVELLKIETYFFEIKKIVLKSKIGAVEPDVKFDDRLTQANNILANLDKARKTFNPKPTYDEYLSIEEELRKELLETDSEPQGEQFKINKEAFDELIEAKEKVLTNQKTMEENYAKAKNAISGEPWEKAMTTLSLIENLKETEFCSLPIQYLGERSKTTITLSPRDPNYKVNTYSTSFVFPIEKTPYFGLSSSFYLSGLQKESELYSVETIPTSDTSAVYRIIQENGSNVELGTAILAKFGEKLTQHFGYHGLLGLGISFTNNVKPRVLAGGGISIGAKNSLNIDGGIAGGQVDLISKVYEDLEAIYSTPPDQITFSKFKFSWFVGIGYFFRF